jgi:hypothetical protein
LKCKDWEPENLHASVQKDIPSLQNLDNTITEFQKSEQAM